MEKVMLVVLGLVWCSLVSAAAAAESRDQIEKECANEVGKVTQCLGYASGKAETPSKECCTTVTGIKESQPKCLCYFIEQAHDGRQEIKSLGIQEARILQLPSACKLANASISDCPKLLGLKPGDPNYAIFSKNASSSATTAAPATGGTSSPAAKADGSDGFKLQAPQLAAGLVAMAVALFS